MLWKTPNENDIRGHLQVTKERLSQSEMPYSLKAFYKASYIRYVTFVSVSSSEFCFRLQLDCARH